MCDNVFLSQPAPDTQHKTQTVALLRDLSRVVPTSDGLPVEDDLSRGYVILDPQSGDPRQSVLTDKSVNVLVTQREPCLVSRLVFGAEGLGEHLAGWDAARCRQAELVLNAVAHVEDVRADDQSPKEAKLGAAGVKDGDRGMCRVPVRRAATCTK